MGYGLSLQGGGVIMEGSVTTEATQSSLYQGVSGCKFFLVKIQKPDFWTLKKLQKPDNKKKLHPKKNPY